MTDWVRLWHDMPTDPKWRVIARKSGQPLACVIAVFTMMLTNASGNSAERGALLGWDDEDAAAALDMDGEQIAAIRSAMRGKVLDGQRLTGWERRQPKREDGTSAERKAAWKERKATHRNASERNGTHRNAPETDAETDKTVPLDKSNGAALPKVDPIKAIFDEGRDLLIASGVGAKQAGSLVGKWRRDHGDGALMEVFTAARSRGLTNPVEWITRGLAARGNERRVSSGQASIEATAPWI